jgi:hypothetical protein
MRGGLFLLATLAVAPVLAYSQPPKPRVHSKITGCLSSIGQPDGYQPMDEKGSRTLVYGVTVHLDSYVGQSVILTGDQCAKPSTDAGTTQPSPHYKVLKVHAA